MKNIFVILCKLYFITLLVVLINPIWFLCSSENFLQLIFIDNDINSAPCIVFFVDFKLNRDSMLLLIKRRVFLNILKNSSLS